MGLQSGYTDKNVPLYNFIAENIGTESFREAEAQREREQKYEDERSKVNMAMASAVEASLSLPLMNSPSMPQHLESQSRSGDAISGSGMRLDTEKLIVIGVIVFLCVSVITKKPKVPTK